MTPTALDRGKHLLLVSLLLTACGGTQQEVRRAEPSAPHASILWQLETKG